MIRIVIAPVIFFTIVAGIAGLALLIGVDRFMSEGRAIINFIGNTVATVVIAQSEKEIDMMKYKQVVEGKPVLVNIELHDPEVSS